MTNDDALDPRWASAVTLRELGELVAEWLEGRMASAPFYGGAPGPETATIAPVLARLNRSGFVTDFSQPAESDDEWAQRAAVCGYCEHDVAERLASLSVRGGLVVVSQPAGYDAPHQLPITHRRPTMTTRGHGRASTHKCARCFWLRGTSARATQCGGVPTFYGRRWLLR